MVPCSCWSPTVLQKSWRMMRHCSAERCYCDELLLGSNHVNLHHPLTFSLTLHTLSVLGVVCVGFLSARIGVCALVELNISPWHLASLSAWCSRKRQRGNANLECCNILSYLCDCVCECVSVCVFVCACISTYVCLFPYNRIGTHSY